MPLALTSLLAVPPRVVTSPSARRRWQTSCLVPGSESSVADDSIPPIGPDPDNIYALSADRKGSAALAPALGDCVRYPL